MAGITQAQFDKRSPVASWEIVQVTFTAAATDLVITHTLQTPDPEQINYEILRISAPARVYHDGGPTRTPWGNGFIRLRCDQAPVQADLLLTISPVPVQKRPLPAGTATATAINADTLDGHDSSFFAATTEAFAVVGSHGSLTNSRLITAGTGITVTDGGAGGNVTIASTVVSGAGKALDSEAYVTIGNTSGLSAERALTGSTAVKITDGGANSTVTVDLNRVFVRKTADETVTSSAALQDDDHITAAIGASEVWEYRLVLVYDAVAAGDFKFAFNVPASATGMFSYHGGDATTVTNIAAGASTDLTDTGAQTVGGNGAGTLVALFINFLVVNSTNAGNVKLRWAQGTSSGTGTILKTNSYLIGHRVA